MNKRYIRTTNEKVFNKKQDRLLKVLNDRIRKNFEKFSKNPETKECLTEIETNPTYTMNDFELSFQGNEIWFEIKWGLVSVCRAVDGTIVIFKLNEIKEYLN